MVVCVRCCWNHCVCPLLLLMLVFVVDVGGGGVDVLSVWIAVI